MDSNMDIKIPQYYHTDQKRDYFCSTCKKYFKTRTGLQDHQIFKHTRIPKTYCCKRCDKIFYRKSKLLHHQVFRHHGIAAYKCELCNTCWSQESMYKQHIKTHADEHYKIYKCNLCLKKFRTLYRFQLHNALHFTKSHRFSCLVCGKWFGSVDILQWHIQCFHADVLKDTNEIATKFLCPCGEKGFKSLEELGGHFITKSHNMKDLLCENIETLNSHLKNVKYYLGICRQAFQLSQMKKKLFDEKSLKFKIKVEIHKTSVQRYGKNESDKSSRITCPVCYKYFDSFQEYFPHIQGHENILIQNGDSKVYKCPGKACVRLLKHRDSFRNHCYIVHGVDEKVKCKDCGKLLKNNKSLKSHYAFSSVCGKDVKIKKLTRDKICSICGKGFKTNVSLKTHLATHKKDHIPVEKRKCKKCFHIVNSEAKLLAHIESQHNNICPVCGESDFPTYISFQCHIKAHNPDEKNSCEISKDKMCIECGKCFSKQRNLNYHIVHMHREKKYKCAVCDHIFATRARLNGHTNIHTKEKNFECKICGVIYFLSKHLTNHMYTVHRGGKNRRTSTDKKYERQKEICPHCGKVCNGNYKLQLHIRVKHSDEKPFQCQFCGKLYKLKDSLAYHNRVVCIGPKQDQELDGGK